MPAGDRHPVLPREDGLGVKHMEAAKPFASPLTACASPLTACASLLVVD